MIKRIQVIVHRYYDTIKLALLIMLLLLSVVTVMNQIEANNLAQRERQETLSRQQSANNRLIRAVNEENDEQTEIINRQFRAICLLIIETAGQEGLQKLDQETRKRCENLGDPTPEEEASQLPPSVPERQSQRNTSSNQASSSPNSTPAEQPSQSENPQTPAPPRPIIPIFDEPILPCLGRICLL